MCARWLPEPFSHLAANAGGRERQGAGNAGGRERRGPGTPGAGDAGGQKFLKVAPFELEISPSESFFRAGSHGDVRLGQNPQNRPFLAGKQNSNKNSHC